MVRDCSLLRDSSKGDRSQTIGSAKSSLSPIPSTFRSSLAPSNRGSCIGRGSGSSAGPNRSYGLTGQQDLEASPDVVICTLSVFSWDVYALIDPGATLSYVTPFVAKKFEIQPKLLGEAFVVSTPIVEFIIASGSIFIV